MAAWFRKLFDDPIQKPETLLRRNREIINSFCEKMVYMGRYNRHAVDNYVRDCLNAIAKLENDPRLAPGYEFYNRWQSSAPKDYKDFAAEIHQMFSKKYPEREKEFYQKQEGEKEEMAKTLYSKYAGLIDKFFDIAYRKVTTVDQYGEENWKAFDKEIIVVLCKIAENEGAGKGDVKSIKQGYLRSVKGFESLKKLIEKDFRDYYDKMKAAPARTDKYEELNGIEFENYLMKIFRASGYDVTGTPTTGDQGADIIVERRGKKIAIQAKKHSNNIGNKAIQEVVGARTYYGCEEAWVITNAKFTRSAIELAQKCGVNLIDGHDLIRLGEIIK